MQGAALLGSAGLTGFAGLVLFAPPVCAPNLFVTSGPARRSGTVAPGRTLCRVRAFMLIGREPAITQAAFRIGGSATPG
ncbi:hypothetical protein [Streptomyces sp. HB132]|uniref:hypothetical protein n=1 Tax=Streptomyces sp. HB132 TaxID=767388 RepID=UPI001D759CF6|nr:hypothetical protein [Streptomyces sp. HB132]MBM7442345.1 p-aminobenzoyl-glutamate transporter AbgT [Streptomyces sp. HB132]